LNHAIRSTGERLFFLPKYSPGLIPFEMLFAKLKHLMRKGARRTGDTISNSIGEILATVTPRECANCFKEAGYEGA